MKWSTSKNYFSCSTFWINAHSGSNIKGHCNPDIAKVLLNHARQSKTQIILNEFTKTTGKTASLVREVSESPIHLHDLFDQHPRAAKMFEQTQQELSGVDNITYNRTSPLDVDLEAIKENKPYDLIYVCLPYIMEQAPNTIETIISKTLELWEMAASDGTIIMGPDYDKDNVKRQVDMFCRQRGYKLEKYLDTNYDNDLEPDHYMFAFQVTKSS